jgi:hypothetical protein
VLAFIKTLHPSRAIWLLMLTGLLYLLPGGLLLAWLRRGKRRDRESWIEQIILAAGLSVAVNAILVYTTLIGLRLSRAAVIGFLAFCGMGILARWALGWRANRWRDVTWQAIQQAARREMSRLRMGHLRGSHDLPQVVLLAVAALVLGVRLYAVRDLAVPMWGDSYQHTMMAQLIVDNGGLFDSWEPYAPLQTFTYHFGLHANVALFHWLSLLDGVGLPVYRSMIWVGQILNVLAVLALYPLALKVSGSRWAGVVAVWIAGLMLPMPMYYVNWGRYTQLAGQAILPVAVVLSWALFDTPADGQAEDAHRPSRAWVSLLGGRWGERLAQIARGLADGGHVPLGQSVLAWIAVAGLAVTHYRVLLFYVAFVLAWLLLKLGRGWRSAWWRALWLGTVPVVVILPWVARTVGSKYAQTVTRQVTTTPDRLSSFSVQYNALGELYSYMGSLGWLLLVVAAASGLWRRRRGVLLIFTWWFLLFVGTNPQMLGLPGSGVITNFALFIATYIPAGILLGDWASSLVDRAGSRIWVHILLALAIIAGGLYGADLRVSDVRIGQHALALEPDVEAMAWIRENTPPDARFLVNSFYAYGGALVVGSDGGWWIPLLARRGTNLPPLNYGSERGPWPEYRLWVNDVTRQIQEHGSVDPATVDMLRERGITHVYIGQQQGRVNYAGPHVLDAQDLQSSPYYRLIYHQDQVWIFELVTESGAQD